MYIIHKEKIQKSTHIYTHTVYIFTYSQYYITTSLTHTPGNQTSLLRLSLCVPYNLIRTYPKPKTFEIYIHMLYYYVIFNLLCTNSGIMPFNVPLTCNIYERQNTKTPILVLITKLSIGKRKYTIINHIKDTIKL